MCSMAKQVQTRLVDDLDGSEAAETVLLGLDGKAFELDLSEKNAKKLRKALGAFLGWSSTLWRWKSRSATWRWQCVTVYVGP
jgi:hypothetical protein